VKIRATLSVLFRRHDPADSVHIGTTGDYVVVTCTPERALELATALAGPGQERTTNEWDERVVELIAEAHRIDTAITDPTVVPSAGAVR
jgi:hypothetical protein